MRVVGALLAGVLLAACGSAVAEGDESARADAAAAIIERDWPLIGSGPVVALVRSVGDRLEDAAGPVSHRWRFAVVRDRSLNALSVGDGRIYVNEGTVARSESEAELAAVLAHEMGHQLAGHFRPRPAGFFSSLFGRRRTDDRATGSLVRSFDLDQELAADRISLRILGRAGYDPHAALSAARQAAEPGEGASRHLGDEHRIRALRSLVAELPRGGRPDSSAFRRVRTELRRRP